LTQVAVPHRVLAVQVDETPVPSESAAAYLERICGLKLEAAMAAVAPDEWVLVADTIVVHQGAIVGKPADRAEARAVLSRLSGATHQVFTRFGLGLGRKVQHVETVCTQVTFRAMGPETIDAYVATGEGDDKAGGYAIQGRAAAFVSRIEGSYANVVGLPVCEVVEALAARLGPP
jgi:septum formation protein